MVILLLGSSVMVLLLTGFPPSLNSYL